MALLFILLKKRCEDKFRHLPVILVVLANLYGFCLQDQPVSATLPSSSFESRPGTWPTMPWSQWQPHRRSAQDSVWPMTKLHSDSLVRNLTSPTYLRRSVLYYLKVPWLSLRGWGRYSEGQRLVLGVAIFVEVILAPYSSVLFKWEFFIQMRATNLSPSALYIATLFWWKERGIKGSSHLNENLSFE